MGLKLNDVAPLTGQPVEQATAAPGEVRQVAIPHLNDDDVERIAKAVVALIKAEANSIRAALV